MARNMFADEPETTGEELDLRKLFLRFLEKDDWTDKLALGFGKIRGRIHRPQRDTKLSKELRLLVPDMKEVEKAYVEMTSGYKDFIRDVVKTSRLRQATRKETSSTVEPSRTDLRPSRLDLSRVLQPRSSTSERLHSVVAVLEFRHTRTVMTTIARERRF